MVVSQTTILSVLGAGLALRGPDGSMMTATDGLYEERVSVFFVFGIGLACTLSAVVICVWVNLHWEAACVCMAITLFTCRKVYTNYVRVCKRFDFDESETVDFRDIFDGAANIHTYRQENRRKLGHINNHQRHHHPSTSNKKGTPSRPRSSRQKKHTPPNPYEAWERPSSPSSNGDEDREMELMVPRNNNVNDRGHGGVQRRAVFYNNGSEVESVGSAEGYPNYIQTV